jgi:oligopeptide/dipeptide ABC transporter ATP-binding protein
MSDDPLLDIADLRIAFDGVTAVSGVSLSVQRGEAVGIVGESGSGKSAAMLAAMRLHPPNAAITATRLNLAGDDVLKISEPALRRLRGGIAAMIFQDPLTALNPLMTIKSQITEVLRTHRKMSPRSAKTEAIDLLTSVGINDPKSCAQKYPHQLSGGMRQRVMIAAALAGDPALLIADEPTTALDVTVQAEITRLIAGLQRERGMGLVWVTHDLALMAGVVDRVVVMYAGRVMETAPVSALYAAPRHPYTAALLRSLPRLDGQRGRTLQGAPPASQAAPGCPFAPRCAHRMTKCEEMPPMFSAGDTQAACWLMA